ncbi:hypothetical protein OF83DRAFT_1176180 [Amylostereum chailletii]|nr:hypothetical protein OF83DRAFT_1176180 [Amylostereum chailletii]
MYTAPSFSTDRLSVQKEYFSTTVDIAGNEHEVRVICDDEKRVETYVEVIPGDESISSLYVTHRHIHYFEEEDDDEDGDEDTPIFTTTCSDGETRCVEMYTEVIPADDDYPPLAVTHRHLEIFTESDFEEDEDEDDNDEEDDSDEEGSDEDDVDRGLVDTYVEVIPADGVCPPLYITHRHIII